MCCDLCELSLLRTLPPFFTPAESCSCRVYIVQHCCLFPVTVCHILSCSCKISTQGTKHGEMLHYGLSLSKEAYLGSTNVLTIPFYIFSYYNHKHKCTLSGLYYQPQSSHYVWTETNAWIYLQIKMKRCIMCHLLLDLQLYVFWCIYLKA